MTKKRWNPRTSALLKEVQQNMNDEYYLGAQWVKNPRTGSRIRVLGKQFRDLMRNPEFGFSEKKWRFVPRTNGSMKTVKQSVVINGQTVNLKTEVPSTPSATSPPQSTAPMMQRMFGTMQPMISPSSLLNTTPPSEVESPQKRGSFDMGMGNGDLRNSGGRRNFNIENRRALGGGARNGTVRRVTNNRPQMPLVRRANEPVRRANEPVRKVNEQPVLEAKEPEAKEPEGKVNNKQEAKTEPVENIKLTNIEKLIIKGAKMASNIKAADAVKNDITDNMISMLAMDKKLREGG